MTTKKITIDPVRRHYNQWVSNELLEDCALRFTALKSRRWSCAQVASTAIGSISFLALEAIGAAITVQYGWINACWAIAVVSVIIFCLGYPIALHAAKAGVDVDLLTRGAGFGYLGSTVTSLIYAGFTFIYFALEAAIMATALQVCFGIPLSVGYLLCSLSVIPVVVYGITKISQWQRYTQKIWIVLQLAPFIFLAWQSISPMEGWTGLGMPSVANDIPFNWLMFGAASAVVFSLTVQIGEQVDYLRFLPERTAENKSQWWFALLTAGPGWIVIGAIKMFAGAYLCLIALNQGLSFSESIDPVHLYLNAWSNWLTPELALAVTGVFVIVCQFKINITNSYAGSIAWSNFFSRLTHSHPGRVVWLVFNVTIAFMLMELGVYKSLEKTLSLYSILGVSWIGSIAADLAINKTLGLSPRGILYKRAQLYDINPVGVGAMAMGTAIGFIAYSGHWGPFLKSMSTYLALISVLFLVPFLAWFTKGRYYRARNDSGPTATSVSEEHTLCSICRNEYDSNDLIHCPAYQNTICSLCCSLDTRCEDQCRPNAPFLAQIRGWTSNSAQGSESRSHRIVTQFFALFFVAFAIVAFTFGLVYLGSDLVFKDQPEGFSSFIQVLFASLLVLAAIMTWIYLLASDSAHRARRDTVQQNELLLQEIKEHEATEAALQQARLKAESANDAKSRYVVGLNHELRTPLNSILGYAHLMENDPELPDHRHKSVRVIRDSAQHLSSLIENLLDISRIEADRLTVQRDRVNLYDFLEQLEQMFQIQAESTGLEFRVLVDPRVPHRVYADEKRLRQILTNLLSNAFKYTLEGYVELSVECASHVTTFRVRDSGVGISASDIERIYDPFETLKDTRANMAEGTGLGLTISKLLAEILGGQLTVSSKEGKGTCFSLKMLLPTIENETVLEKRTAAVNKQLASEKLVIVVDDDLDHRNMVREYLSTLGFQVRVFVDGKSCLEAIPDLDVDVFLLDISMPGMDGWALAEAIKAQCEPPVRILMVSALADNQVQKHVHDSSSMNYFVKPLDFDKLSIRLQEILKLNNGAEDNQIINKDDSTRMYYNAIHNSIEIPTNDYTVSPELISELKLQYSIGHLSAIRDTLNDALEENSDIQEFVEKSQWLLDRHRLNEFGSLLNNLSE